MSDTLSDTLQHEVAKKPASAEQPQATVVVVQGSEADLGAHARVLARAVIGRDPAAELSLTDPSASKQHAAIEALDDGTYLLHDLGSKNGTLVDGKPVSTPFPLRDGDKIAIAGTVCRFVLADAIDAAFHAQVDAMLSTDALTGLLAYRRFDAALDEALRTAQATGTPLTLLVLDLDGLKAINDAHGHAMGAFTIGRVGRLLAEVLGAAGVATRFGGDEFVAFLPGLPRDAGLMLAEELRSRVEREKFLRAGRTADVTVSIGVACYPERARERKALFEAADRALYRAKARGKNQVAS
ncbi:MAG: GGDEF domain-containing protein [Archangium sp.]|nr:GGDEF domain-containing protein [Archangium sp.]MDP3156349.1 GGDEF domain-containing protein [Archangium sp.]MDP3570393.1 GGDEF domain-containing protein [Archangium sp.]